MKKETIEQLINEFLEECEYVANCFYMEYNRKDLLRASNEGVIEKAGKVKGLQYYSFHGIGLYARRKNCTVDFDFGLNDRIDGFDSWRLNQFAQSRKENKNLWTQDKIQSELDRLERNREISKLKRDIAANYYKK